MASSEQIALYLTRIFDFGVDPTRPVVGSEVTVQGTLKWKKLWYWVPLGGQTVKLVVDGEVVDTQTTKTGLGTFKFTWSPPRKAVYWVHVRYDGTIIYNPCETEDVRVEAITQEEKEEEELRLLLMVGGGAGLGLLAVGAVVYSYDRQRRYEMLMLAR